MPIHKKILGVATVAVGIATGNPVMIAGGVISLAGGIDAAEDAEDAFHKQAANAQLEAAHRKKVAEFNAAVFTANAIRLREEMAGRLNEVAGVNIVRLQDTRITNVNRIGRDRRTDLGRTSDARDLTIERLGDALGVGTERITLVSDKDRARITEDFERLADELSMDATRDIDRIKEVVTESVTRIGRRAGDVATTGFEIENDLRQQIAQDVSSQRSFYAAGNIIVNTGTPMRLQVDAYQQGEIRAQRIRRDYKIQVRDLKDTASDNLRTALFQVEDIRTETSRRFEAGFRLAERGTEDINLTEVFKLSDLYRSTNIAVEDVNLETDFRLDDIRLTADRKTVDINLLTTTSIDDIDRTLGYDLSDNDFKAVQLDQQATLTLMQGDAAVIAGENRADALEQAGEDAFFGGVTSAVGEFISNIPLEGSTKTKKPSGQIDPQFNQGQFTP